MHRPTHSGNIIRKRWHYLIKNGLLYPFTLMYYILPSIVLLGSNKNYTTAQYALTQMSITGAMIVLCRNKKYLPALIRWPKTQKTPQSQPYRAEIPCAIGLAATVAYILAQQHNYTNTTPYSFRDLYVIPATMLVTYIYCIVPLLQVTYAEGYIRNDITGNRLTRTQKTVFLLQQCIYSSCSMCLHIYGNYVPIKKLASIQKNIITGRVLNALVVTGIAHSILPKRFKNGPMYLGLMLAGMYCFDEIYPALLYGAMHERSGNFDIFLSSYIGYCCASSYYYTQRLITPILLNIALHATRYTDTSLFGLRVCPTYPYTQKRKTKKTKHNPTILGYGLSLFKMKSNSDVYSAFIAANTAQENDYLHSS